MDYIKSEDFKARPSPELPKLNQYKPSICEWYISLDTETSWNHNQDNPKAWIYSFAFKYGDSLVYGRRPSELIRNLKDIQAVNGLSKKKRLIVYVHNLSYDIAYLKEFMADTFGEVKYLVNNPHKYISFECGGYIFKCSYRLSQKSLLKWSKDLGTEFIKDSTGIDYHRIYYQDSTIPSRYIEYQLMDILTLDACIQKQLEIYKDRLDTIPLTATGYVRRDIRKAFQKEDYDKVKAGKSRGTNRLKFTKMRLNTHVYKANRRAFHGGYTHSNRFLTNRILTPAEVEGCTYIRHRDFRSHYPSQQRCYKFPAEKWSRYSTVTDDITINDLLEKRKEGYCILANLVINDIELQPHVTMPMLQTAKIQEGREQYLKIIDDNGRVLKCKGQFNIWVTEYELIEILEQYKPFMYQVRESYIARADYLPSYMINTIDYYFKGKSDFKNKAKEIEKRIREGEQLQAELNDAHINLMKSKAGLNSIYGCSATNPVHPEYVEDDEGEWSAVVDYDDEFITEALEKYYNNRNNCMSYQYGLYTTALAQYELYEYIKAIGYDKVIYCDTDSIFYFSTNETEKSIAKLNRKKNNNAKKCNAYITDDNGNIIYYDSFDDEGENIIEFKALHSKCYGYNEEGYHDNQGKRHLVIAGVTAFSRDFDNDHMTRIDELGDLDNLTHGKVFEKCGGTMAVYVKDNPHVELINGHPTELASSCIIMDNIKSIRSLEIDEDDEFIVEKYEIE